MKITNQKMCEYAKRDSDKGNNKLNHSHKNQEQEHKYIIYSI